MKQVILNITDRDYKIVSKCAFVRDRTVEQYALEAMRQSASSDLSERIGFHLGFGDKPSYDDVWSPDVEGIMKGAHV